MRPARIYSLSLSTNMADWGTTIKGAYPARSDIEDNTSVFFYPFTADQACVSPQYAPAGMGHVV
jgi:hypothetical protein